MLNVQSLTNTMSRMTLPQLQQYAALHKDDPYVVTLALSIANQKKQMGVAQAGQAGMMPQPKVVDQDIARITAPQQSALPEEVGIGALPAPNMQRMAGGGIVAFDEGGEVPGYESGVYTGVGDIPDWVKRLPPESGIRMYYEKKARGEPLLTKPLWDTFTDYLKSPSAPAAAQTPAPATSPALPPSATQIMSGLPSTAATPAAPVTTAPPPTTKPPVATKPAAPTDPMAGIKALDTSVKTPAQAKEEAKALSDSTELRANLEANEKFTTQAYDKLLGDYDKKVAELPEAYKGYEERLKKEEAEAATDKDKALGLAIFQAGLGMMSGTSQYAFENIGKGALAGLDNYQAALKDLKKAQRERDKAFADIEAARLAEKRGDIKAHTELQAKGIDALGAAKNRTVEGIAKIFDVDSRTATGIFETSLKDKAQNERTMYTTAADMAKQKEADRAALERTKIQAYAPTGLERIYRDPALFKKHLEAQTAATGMRSDTTIRETWAKSPYLQAQFPNVDEYVKMMLGTTGTGGADGAFKVLGSRPGP